MDVAPALSYKVKNKKTILGTPKISKVNKKASPFFFYIDSLACGIRVPLRYAGNGGCVGSDTSILEILMTYTWLLLAVAASIVLWALPRQANPYASDVAQVRDHLIQIIAIVAAILILLSTS